MLKKLIGSEKQIKWAEDIRNIIIEQLNYIKQNANEKFLENAIKLEEIILNNDGAEYFIDNFKELTDKNSVETVYERFAQIISKIVIANGLTLMRLVNKKVQQKVQSLKEN